MIMNAYRIEEKAKDPEFWEYQYMGSSWSL